MKNHFLFSLVFFSIVMSVSAQAEKTELYDEFPAESCEFLLARADSYANLLNKNPDLKIYIIYYEGKQQQEIYDKKEKEMKTVLVAPRRGEAKNKTEAITLYLTKYRKISPDRFVLIDGGYDTEYHAQVWSVPNGAEPPKPRPFENIKTMKYRKGKAPKVVDCQGAY